MTPKLIELVEQQIFYHKCISTSTPLENRVNYFIGAKLTSTRTKKYEFYTGVTTRRFKDRYYEHQSNSRHEDKRHKSTLSEHICKLRDMDEPYTVSWWVIDRGRAFNPTTKTCDICSKEKYHIMFNPQTATLNSRREVFATCRHRTKLLLCNYGD